MTVAPLMEHTLVGISRAPDMTGPLFCANVDA